jgi:hypothetical protein
MDRTYLQWNLENWITVLLMASLGMAFTGFVASGIRSLNGRNNA